MAYSPRKELEWCLARPAVARAQRVPLTPLTHLAHRLDAAPDSVVTISDVHGRTEDLIAAVDTLGLLGPDGMRVPGRGTVIQLGDLVDGRHPAQDAACIARAADVCDIVLAGNHEAALMGGPRFAGQPDFVFPETIGLLERLAREGRLVGAVAVGDVLLTHAGIDPVRTAQPTAAEAAQALCAAWDRFLESRLQWDPQLFAIGADRGGTGAGGALWRDFASVVADPAPYRQIVGHTPIGGVDADSDARVICTDTGGPRVGVTLIEPDGTIWVSSTLIPDDQRAPDLTPLIVGG